MLAPNNHLFHGYVSIQSFLNPMILLGASATVLALSQVRLSRATLAAA